YGTASEKRRKFLSKGNNSVGAISDHFEGLEGISVDAASTENLSVTSSGDDLDKAHNEMETDAIFDNVSFSGRATPNLSGRDTPSSYRSLDSNDHRRQEHNSQTNHNSANLSGNHPNNHILSTSPITMFNSQNTNNSNRQNSIPYGLTAIPTTVEKPFRQDVTEKFHNFDLLQQTDVDETRSVLSDNWSLTPGLSDYSDVQEQISRLNEIIEELPISQTLIFPENNGTSFKSVKSIDQQSDCWSTEAFASDSETHSEDGTKRITIVKPDRTNSIADPVDIMLMKSSLESISSMSDSGILDSAKTSLISSNISAISGTILKSSLQIENKQKNPLNFKLSESLNNLLIFDPSQNNVVPSSTMSTINSEIPAYENSMSSSSSSSLVTPFSGQTQLSPATEKKETVTTPITTPNYTSTTGEKQTSSKPHAKSRSSNLSTKLRLFSGRFNSKSRDREEMIRTQQSDGNVTADDILSKYATNKTSQQTNAIVPPVTVKINGNNDLYTMEKRDTITNELTNDTVDTSPYYDSSNFDTCKAFTDAKKKLRYVLSFVDPDCCSSLSSMTMSIVMHPNSSISSSSLSTGSKHQNNLILFLRSQLYEAISMQDRDLQTQLYETLRFIQQFSETECKEIVRSMGNDYRSRTIYIAYLVKNIENLLNSMQHQEKLLLRIQRDQELCKQHLINYLSKLYLDSDVHERHLVEFIEHFQQLSIGDEKMHLVEVFLDKCNRELLSDINLKAASPEQIQMAQTAIERMVMSKIYTQALYPNGQVDVQRDQVFSTHITRLAEEIGPNHPKLRIQKVFQRECPWPSAQAELILINAYKTPRDKVGCVQRSIRIIQNLIRLSSNSAAGADDTIPILIFVIIKANPPSLLSNLQYVQDLHSSRLTNEESYNWTMFVSAVRFVCELIN
ncbi:unnamed protein product, partial [Didymodactylos carnosus]